MPIWASETPNCWSNNQASKILQLPLHLSLELDKRLNLTISAVVQLFDLDFNHFPNIIKLNQLYIVICGISNCEISFSDNKTKYEQRCMRSIAWWSERIDKCLWSRSWTCIQYRDYIRRNAIARKWCKQPVFMYGGVFGLYEYKWWRDEEKHAIAIKKKIWRRKHAKEGGGDRIRSEANERIWKTKRGREQESTAHWDGRKILIKWKQVRIESEIARSMHMITSLHAKCVQCMHLADISFWSNKKCSKAATTKIYLINRERERERYAFDSESEKKNEAKKCNNKISFVQHRFFALI